MKLSLLVPQDAIASIEVFVQNESVLQKLKLFLFCQYFCRYLSLSLQAIHHPLVILKFEAIYDYI